MIKRNAAKLSRMKCINRALLIFLGLIILYFIWLSPEARSTIHTHLMNAHILFLCFRWLGMGLFIIFWPKVVTTITRDQPKEVTEYWLSKRFQVVMGLALFDLLIVEKGLGYLMGWLL